MQTRADTPYKAAKWPPLLFLRLANAAMIISDY
jgi:hypothetical protein